MKVKFIECNRCADWDSKFRYRRKKNLKLPANKLKKKSRKFSAPQCENSGVKINFFLSSTLFFHLKTLTHSEVKRREKML